MTTIDPESGRFRVTLQGVALLAATGGLGGTAVNGGDLRPLRMLGAALVPVAVLAFASRSKTRLTLHRALGLALTCAAVALGVASDSTDLWLYLGSILVLLAVAPPLARRVADLLALVPLAGISATDSESGQVTSLDDLASRELARARRAGRPLSVVSLSLDHHSMLKALMQQKEVAAAAADLMAVLRQTDVFGYRGSNRFVALLVETSGTAAVGAMYRLVSELDSGVARNLRAGIASFPDDNLTWEGLKELARERERPLVDVSETAPLVQSVEVLA